MQFNPIMSFPFRKISQSFCFICLSMTLRASGTVETLLAREIIGPTQTLAEVQAYTENRVPLMPEVKSAEEWNRIAARLRLETLDRVIFRGEAARWRDARTKVEWLDTIE